VAYVNCRDAHGPGDQKCLLRERQVEVSRVRVVQKLSYDEAVKKLEENGSKVRGVLCIVELYQYRGIGQQVIYVSVRLGF
jgi:DNA-directed RNA polymerase alpha subunit